MQHVFSHCSPTGQYVNLHSLLVEASRNKMLDVNLPLLNVPAKEVFSVGRMFSEKMVSAWRNIFS